MTAFYHRCHSAQAKLPGSQQNKPDMEAGTDCVFQSIILSKPLCFCTLSCVTAGNGATVL
ncbi:hypothetical protein EB241_20395 [Erwinia psidii]|uniref:Uncharacterized protein n=1 Tax=Erwinia psidii TaxID=69224 RepID=A0A3N6SFW0_9GAMM|nr:hypothetical protein EB241_20395 [Erwinia psidii]